MTPDEIYAFHQTPPDLAKRLMDFVPIQSGDRLYEPFRGEGAFFNAFPTTTTNLWAEIRKEKDYKDEQEYDWVITNPPFRLEEGNTRINGFWLTLDYFSSRAKKGVAFLFNKQCLEALTPKRIEILQQRGFHIQKIVVCSVKKWAGRYYFLVLSKQPANFLVALRENW
jgi:hypothetical protein